MKPELMKKWFFVQNGRQIDIHVKDCAEDREITVVANVRDEECAYLIAGAPRYREALEKIVGLMKLPDGEIDDFFRARQMYLLAFDALNHADHTESESLKMI